MHGSALVKGSFLMLVAALSSAHAGQIAGTSFEQSPRAWRVGGSSAAHGTSIRMRLAGDTFTLRALHWKTGAQHVSGSWDLRLVTEDYGTGQLTMHATTVMTMIPNAWNSWTLPSPVLLTACGLCSRRLEIIPAGTAESDFVNIGGLAGDYVDTQVGYVYGSPPSVEAMLVNPTPGGRRLRRSHARHGTGRR